MINDRIPEILGRFAHEIRAEVQRQAVEALSGGFVGGAKPAKLKPDSASAKPRAARKGSKRDPKLLDQLQARVLAFVTKKPGLRVEQINKELGTTTKDLALPIKKLLTAKAINAHGQKRATTYAARK
jgi:hypothetical protein